MKRFLLIRGLAVAVVGAVLSGIVVVPWSQGSFPFSLQFVMMVIAPSVILGRALGIPEGDYHWLWCLLTMVLNTGLCFLAGALAGCFLYLLMSLMRCPSREHESVG